MRRALSLAGACVALAACASVLGVDKTYVLAGADGGKAEVDGAAPSSGIRCAAGGPSCTAGPEECCFGSDDSLSCIGASTGCSKGTDIFCDDPSQCDAGACCLSVQQPGSAILGTVCRSACASPDVTLCARQDGTCSGGLACKPVALAAPFGGGWFYGCQ